MKVITSAVAATLILVFLLGKSAAINGIGVYVHWWTPFEINDYGVGYPRGTIVKATIQGNKVISHDTLFKQVAEYPALSFDGKRIAFFRWGKQVQYSNGYYHVVAGTATSPNYLSIMNIDGSNLQNLVQVADPAPSTYLKDQQWTEGNAVLDWPAGDWIYYEKPTKTSEIWRINVRVPSRNELVCKYVSTDYIRRWDLAIDAKHAGAQVVNMDVGGVLNGGSTFPLINNSISQSSPAGAAGCNAAVSCGAGFIALYEGGEHTEMVVYAWNHSTNRIAAYNRHTIANLEQWIPDTLVKPGYGGADLIRWSANSEKWVLRQIGWCWQSDWMDMGTNSVAVNWKDKQAINLSHTKMPMQACGDGPAQTPPSDCAEAGDLWIDFGAGNENKWEDENGTLHAQTPVDPVGIFAEPIFTNMPPIQVLKGMRVTIADRAEYAFSAVNAQGEVVISSQGHGPETIDIHSLKPGLYMIRALIQGRAFAEKIIATR